MAWLAAALVAAETDCLSQGFRVAERSGLSRNHLYEIVLQSYLFLGFPRMLIAAEALAQHFPPIRSAKPVEPFTPAQSELWHQEGLATCKKVYGDSMEVLMSRVGAIAPEIAQWMIIEGYGKVLSRPGLDLASREICIVVMLLLENREQQLHSHLRGALRVGVGRSTLVALIEGLRELSPEGVRTALVLMERLR